MMFGTSQRIFFVVVLFSIQLFIFAGGFAVAQREGPPSRQWKRLLAKGELEKLKNQLTERLKNVDEQPQEIRELVFPTLENTKRELDDLKAVLSLPINDQNDLIESLECFAHSPLRLPRKQQENLEEAIQLSKRLIGENSLLHQRVQFFKCQHLYATETIESEMLQRSADWFLEEFSIDNPEAFNVVVLCRLQHSIDGNYDTCMEMTEQILESWQRIDSKLKISSRQFPNEEVLHARLLEAKHQIIRYNLDAARIFGASEVVDEASRCLDNAVHILDKLPETEPGYFHYVGEVHSRRARNHLTLWEFDQAIKEQELAIKKYAKEKTPAFQRNNTSRTLETQHWLARTNLRREKIKESAQMFSQLILKFEEKQNRGRHDISYANSLYHLAECQLTLGEFSKAVESSKKNLLLYRLSDKSFIPPIQEIVDQSGAALCAANRPQEAIDVIDSFLKEKRPLSAFDRAKLLKRLALASHFHDPQDERALELIRKSHNELQRYLDEQFLTYYEPDAAKVYQQLIETVGLMNEFDNNQSARDNLLNVLGAKGLISNALARRSQLLNAPENVDLRDQYISLQDRLESFSLKPTLIGKSDTKVAEEQIKKLLTELVKRAGNQSWMRHPKQVLSQLEQHLPDDVAVVEFIESVSLAKNTAGKANQIKAFIIRKDVKTEEVLVSEVVLDDMETVQQEAQKLANSLTLSAVEKNRGVKSRKPKLSSFDLHREALRKLIWEKIAPNLDGQKNIVLCPVSGISLIPFDVLPDKLNQKKYLIQSYQIQYADSASEFAEILAGDSDRRRAEEFVVVGAIDYGKSKNKGPEWPELQGTNREVEGFEVFRSTGNIEKLSGKTVSDQTLLNSISTADHIQIATHGYQNAQLGTRLGIGLDRFTSRNAFANAGLVLSQANASLTSNSIEDLDRSFLSAQEILIRDLSNVQFAFISACHAGSGSTLIGETQLSLQKAFRVAGVRTTVSNLIAVEDNTASILTNRFNELKASHSDLPVSEVFRRARLELLQTEATEHPKYWGGWQLYGDWR